MRFHILQTRSTVAAIALLAAVSAGSPARSVAAVRQVAPAVPDCAVLAYRGGFTSVLPRFESMDPPSGRQCVAQLFQSLSGEDRSDTSQGDSALAVEELAKAGFVEDPRFISPLVACMEQRLQAAEYCNRILASLTRQSYGWAYFYGDIRTRTPEHYKRVVADWREYERLLKGGRPIFDSMLSDASASAIRAVKSRLAESLAVSVKYHSILGYLRDAGPSTIPRKQGQAQVVYYFGLGGFGLGPGFATPSNWIGQEPPRGLRFLMFRPGVSRPSSDPWPEQEIEQFSVTDADHRERFPALDLEIRFQIVTSNDAQRRATIQAVHDALSGLGALNGTF